MYKPINYKIKELAHPQIINAIGEQNTWKRLDADCLRDLQTIRNKWFKIHKSGIYVNRVNVGLDSRGLRPPNDPDGAFYSTHKQGNTFDLEPVNGYFEELYEFIIDLIQNNELQKINTLEDFKFTKKWVHIGYMNTHKKPLIIQL